MCPATIWLIKLARLWSFTKKIIKISDFLNLSHHCCMFLRQISGLSNSVGIPIQSQKSHWNSYQLKFGEISPKIPRMQISRKLSPLLPPLYSPPWPPWSPLGSKKILGGFWHLFMSNPSHLAQKIRQNHQLWSNRCMTPFVAALCIAISNDGSNIERMDQSHGY